MSYSHYSHDTAFRTGGTRGTYQNRSSLPRDRNILDGLRQEAIQTLSKPQQEECAQGAIKPENVKYIGSYNWVEETTPTIIVPGSPPEWCDRPFPYQVQYDTDISYVDQNGYRMGRASGLLPLFRAVDVVAEENADTPLDWSSIDVVTDRNGLRKLMRWLQFSSGAVKDFRIDLQLGGNKTLLLSRWEKRARRQSEPPKSGCGLNFEKASTTPAKGCERGTGHHRIVQYDMGGLRMIVRCEMDACIPNPPSSETESKTKTTTKKTSTVDELTDMMSGLDVTKCKPITRSVFMTSGDISVIRAGSQLPQSSMVEITTRSVGTVEDFDWIEQYPQLLLAHVPHIFLAVHQRGSFQRIKKHELGSAAFRNVENHASLQRAFRQLVQVLRDVQGLVKEHGKRGRLSLVCRNGTLEVFERTSEQGAIPDSDLERFGN